MKELQAFTTGPGGAFREFKKARPPWLWADRRGGALDRRGALLEQPWKLYSELRAARRP